MSPLNFINGIILEYGHFITQQNGHVLSLPCVADRGLPMFAAFARVFLSLLFQYSFYASHLKTPLFQSDISNGYLFVFVSALFNTAAPKIPLYRKMLRLNLGLLWLRQTLKPNRLHCYGSNDQRHHPFFSLLLYLHLSGFTAWEGRIWWQFWVWYLVVADWRAKSYTWPWLKGASYDIARTFCPWTNGNQSKMSSSKKLTCKGTLRQIL